MMTWDGWQRNCNDLCWGTVLSYHLLGGTEEVLMKFSGWPSCESKIRPWTSKLQNRRGNHRLCFEPHEWEQNEMGVIWKVKLVSYYEADKVWPCWQMILVQCPLSWLFCGYVTIVNPLMHFVSKISELHDRYSYMYALLLWHWSGTIKHWI